MKSASYRFGLATIATIAIFGVADAILLRSSNVTIGTANIWALAKVSCAIAFMFGASLLVKRRLALDPSRIAKFILDCGAAVSIGAKVSLFFVGLSLTTSLFMYLASATNRPLADEYLASIDYALGFDWKTFLAEVNSYPLLSRVLVWSYHALGTQVPLLLVLLCARHHHERAFEFVALLAVTSLFTAAGMAAFPAAGAYAYFQPQRDMFSNFSSNAGMWHFAELTKLRTGQPYEYVVGHIQGLVTFPSFHTSLGIIIVYVLREHFWLACAVAILNAIMIVGTLPEGGHHLIDVLAGSVVALLSIAVVWAVGQPTHRFRSLPASSPAGEM